MIKAVMIRLAGLRDAFWMLPAVMIAVAVALGAGLVSLERNDLVSPWLLDGWLYGGGESGARAVLGAIATSTISVAGTLFSITIASLALASNQMGPRLLRNFTRDRANQLTLGLFLGVFAYAVVVLRSVRGTDEGPFVPHLAVSAAVALALVCVGALVFFIHRASSRISVDVVIELVQEDLWRALDHVAGKHTATPAPPPCFLSEVRSRAGLEQSGYVDRIDEDALADFAAQCGAELRLHLKPGDFVFPGRPVLEASKPLENLDRRLADAVTVSPRGGSSLDLEFTVRQLVEVAVRALSPGINDPRTAMSVLDRLAAVLCGLAGRALPTGLHAREGRVVFIRDALTYPVLTERMFTLIRQSAAGSPEVLIHMVEVLTAVAEVEDARERIAVLRRHAAHARDGSEGAAWIVDDRRRLRAAWATFERRAARAHSRVSNFG